MLAETMKRHMLVTMVDTRSGSDTVGSFAMRWNRHSECDMTLLSGPGKIQTKLECVRSVASVRFSRKWKEKRDQTNERTVTKSKVTS